MKFNNLNFTLICSIILFLSCGKTEEESNTPIVITPVTFDLKVNPALTYQTIAGFGAANRMWGTQFLKPAEAAKAFNNDDNSLGLSLFRVRIPSNPNEWQNIVEACKEAKKYGIKIFASSWSPPAALKSNNSDIGGHLLPENYSKFKDHLNAYITFMKNNGVEVDVVSVQNEPDIKVTYESCDWTAQEMIDFIKTQGDKIIGAQLSGPESYNFNEAFTNALLNDADVVKNLDIVSGHIYGAGQRPFPLALEKKKEIWMTEYLLNLNVGNTGVAWSTLTDAAKWDETLTMLTTVNTAMLNNWNAYIWWYVQRFYSFIGDGEQGTANGEILKRGYAFSHFAKYVRPGALRIDLAPSKATNLKLSAYKSGNKVIVQIINPDAFTVKDLLIKGASANTAQQITTSISENRVVKNLTPKSGEVAFEIGPKSMTTIVIN
jgi:glucuronoarabinoxylan endo-1,4-beta-xylanase